MMPRSIIPFSLALVLIAALSGCSRSKTAKDPELVSAVDVLKQGLDGWKNGNSPASLESGANPVQFSDSDWKAGAKLLDYQVLKAGGEDDGETLCTVRLKLEIKGKESERTVNYIVVLAPTRIISRAPKI